MRVFAGTNRPDKIILHCSASGNKSHDDISVIESWHKEMGFRTCGYHYFVKMSGEIQIARYEDEQGAHCHGQNKKSIGICLSGKDEGDFTIDQYIMAGRLISNILLRYNFTINEVYGHNVFSNKLCPVFSVKNFKNRYIIQ